MKFSVLLPTRNRLDLLARAIETVRKQDYDNWEIIVSDNFSQEDVSGYISSLADSRIKFHRTESFVPVTDNWNNSLDKSDGDYVIMLGDDDCLMKGYFSKLKKLIEDFDSPDFIYTSAYLYAYPGVVPESLHGFLRTYNQRGIFQSSKTPFWLDRDTAKKYVEDSLNFRASYDYNAQFFLVSRQLINVMKCYGQFYQSPYPDYYSSNAMMLKAKRILVVPLPLVAIGISPKSFGFYYFNDIEDVGNTFLNNIPDKKTIEQLKDVILPGSAMNTSWLLSMIRLEDNFSEEFNVEVNFDRYRVVQILSLYAGVFLDQASAKRVKANLERKMTWKERFVYALPYNFLNMIVFGARRHFRAVRIQERSGSHPGAHMPLIEGEFETILDVFTKID